MLLGLLDTELPTGPGGQRNELWLSVLSVLALGPKSLRSDQESQSLWFCLKL